MTPSVAPNTASRAPVPGEMVFSQRGAPELLHAMHACVLRPAIFPACLRLIVYLNCYFGHDPGSPLFIPPTVVHEGARGRVQQGKNVLQGITFTTGSRSRTVAKTAKSGRAADAQLSTTQPATEGDAVAAGITLTTQGIASSLRLLIAYHSKLV